MDNNHVQTETLELVQIFHRHGERSPLQSIGSLYPTGASLFPQGWGNLTKKGEEQTYELGTFIRHRYDGFLHHEYKGEEIQVVSSDVDRTIQSGLSVLRGVYPVKNSSHSAPQFQIVPIRTIPAEVDNILQYTVNSSEYEKLFFKSMMESPAIRQLEIENQGKLKQFNEVTGGQFKAWGSLIHAMDFINVLRHQGKELPSWADDQVVKILTLYHLHIMQMPMKTMALKRRRVPTVEKIVANMESKMGGMKQKVLIYSCHDLTLLGILAVLGFQAESVPFYASSIIFELHKKPDVGYIVQMFYRNTDPTDNVIKLIELNLNLKSPLRVDNIKEILTLLQNGEEPNTEIISMK